MTALPMTEDQFAATVLGIAQWGKWRAVHIRNVRMPSGHYAVPYEGDKGLPDWILARCGVVLLVELKVGGNKPTADQRAWLAAAGPNGRLWYPKDIPAIRAELLARAAMIEYPEVSG